ncbi:MAG TPA: hypothetical protein VK644_04765 [Chitinophagaceae bacterium]|nr:hypothetical protein [Chitinophagaceae bacterium]
MKTCKLLFLFIFLPLVFHAQHSLTGLWTGSLSNDSSTIRKDQSYEIALTQYKEKVYGYTRTTFIVHDTLFYMVKRVKGTIDGDVCEIKDDEILSNNFPGRIDKGVKVTTTFRMNKQDTTWYLAGDWKTNKTKNFYSISGKIALKEETNLDNSKLFPHLEELKVANDVAFYKASKTPPIAIVARVQAPKKEPEKTKKPDDLAKKEKTKTQADLQPKETEPIVASGPEKKPVSIPPAASQKPEEKSTASAAPAKDITSKKEPVREIPPVIITPVTKIPEAAAFVATRKTIAPQIVTFSADSLELALYDNGEVDGDTVSVLLNGEVILAKQGLKTVAIKKTIYIPAGTNEINLVLYAENLGKYPPNTGLLIVHDNEEVYQIRFSADLQQNAAIIFRRKK